MANTVSDALILHHIKYTVEALKIHQSIVYSIRDQIHDEVEPYTAQEMSVPDDLLRDYKAAKRVANSIDDVIKYLENLELVEKEKSHE